MRTETVTAWMFVGFSLLTIAALLYIIGVSQLAIFMSVLGVAYFFIGIVLSLMHDRHMAKRTRAERARE